MKHFFLHQLIMGFVFLRVLTICIILNKFQILKQPFIPGINIMIMVYNAFYVLLSPISSYFGKKFWINIYDGYWSVILFIFVLSQDRIEKFL